MRTSSNLNNYALAWSLIEDGVETQNGTIADIEVAAQQTKNFTIPYDLSKVKGRRCSSTSISV